METVLMKALVKSTGEVIECDPKDLTELMSTWRMYSEYEKAYKAMKDQLKPLVEQYISDRGVSEESGGYMFRQSTIQRMNYDKTVLRQVLDEDTFDLLLEPNKTAVDTYLKENLEELGDKSTEIRSAMVPTGKPYQVIRAEKLTREGK